MLSPQRLVTRTDVKGKRRNAHCGACVGQHLFRGKESCAVTDNIKRANFNEHEGRKALHRDASTGKKQTELSILPVIRAIMASASKGGHALVLICQNVVASCVASSMETSCLIKNKKKRICDVKI